HVVYANDRSRIHSGPYAKHGNRGTTASADPTIPKDEPGHPIEHKFTSAIPTSQCMVCHVHPGTTAMNSYLGYMCYDEEAKARPTPQKLAAAVEWPNQAREFHHDPAKQMAFGDPAVGARAARDAEDKLNACRKDTPVHLMDIHLEKGMHCVDCHFSQDVHGNNR